MLIWHKRPCSCFEKPVTATAKSRGTSSSCTILAGQVDKPRGITRLGRRAVVHKPRGPCTDQQLCLPHSHSSVVQEKDWETQTVEAIVHKSLEPAAAVGQLGTRNAICPCRKAPVAHAEKRNALLHQPILHSPTNFVVIRHRSTAPTKNQQTVKPPLPPVQTVCSPANWR
jgi:hypothetical protein